MKTIQEIKDDYAKSKLKFKDWADFLFCWEDEGNYNPFVLKQMDKVTELYASQFQLIGKEMDILKKEISEIKKDEYFRGYKEGYYDGKHDL